MFAPPGVGSVDTFQKSAAHINSGANGANLQWTKPPTLLWQLLSAGNCFQHRTLAKDLDRAQQPPDESRPQRARQGRDPADRARFEKLIFLNIWAHVSTHSCYLLQNCSLLNTTSLRLDSLLRKRGTHYRSSRQLARIYALRKKNSPCPFGCTIIYCTYNLSFTLKRGYIHSFNFNNHLSRSDSRVYSKAGRWNTSLSRGAMHTLSGRKPENQVGNPHRYWGNTHTPQRHQSELGIRPRICEAPPCHPTWT